MTHREHGRNAAALGVVITLPAGLRQRIGQLRADFEGPCAGLEPPHITLVSGQISGTWEAARAHAALVASRSEAFTVSLKGVASFVPASEVVFLKVAQGAEECRALHARLCDGPLEHRVAFDYHPHLTVTHDAPRPQMRRALDELQDFDAEFVVESIGLFTTDHDGHWVLTEELTLGTDGCKNAAN
ncbi:2'-5' RNA ligase family protein [Zhihengliuella flava]|uniref:2'-5' RNA ligase n=1 Tax=Zhihengliuella flava TaxID=1285193 RepID=A0A931D7V9_9MICC|nr:2'-5' RNA ligase family protein [Zhihengliuella flava]MBG6084024.1 2'-5' RNA ligase [Zhihengliuella flava]